MVRRNDGAPGVDGTTLAGVEEYGVERLLDEVPRSWAEDHDRCADAGIPADKPGFATKPTLAATLIERAVGARIPAGWVAGDEAYGADPRLRAAIRGHGLGYVMAVAANRRVPTHAGPIRVDALPAQIPAHAWQKHSAGAGAHGPRLYSWAWFGLLADRSLFPGGCPGCMHPSRVVKDHEFGRRLTIWTIGMYSSCSNASSVYTCDRT